VKRIGATHVKPAVEAVWHKGPHCELVVHDGAGATAGTNTLRVPVGHVGREVQQQ